MSNSSLATYKRITSNKTSPRNHVIDTITIHCIVGQWTAKQGCDYFATTDRQVSANYVVGKDGSIGLSVDENDRAWCSGGYDGNGKPIRVNGISGADNDHRAITIEVASDTTPPYAVTDKAYNALIKLVADICKRNNIKKLLWKADKSLVGQVDKQNMTVHRWFANKSCPGEYLYSRHGDIAKKVNALLGNASSTSVESKVVTAEYHTMSVGAKLSLTNVSLYVSSSAPNKSSSKTGTFYLWSNEVVKGRVRITDMKSKVGVVGQVTGWVNVEDVIILVAPYKVRVTTSALNVRKSPGTNSAEVGCIRNRGVCTIVAEAFGKGATKWGKMNNGAGWISLDYTKKV